MRQLAKPEIRHGGQHLTLAGYRVGQDHVECGQTVALDDQHAFVVDRVEIAHFAAMEELQRLETGFVQWL